MAEQREAVRFFIAGGMSIQRAGTLVQIHRSTFRYIAHPTDDTALLRQIEGLAQQYPRYGYRRITVLLNQSQRVNQKRVRRLWKLHGLWCATGRIGHVQSACKPPILVLCGPMILLRMLWPMARRCGS